MILPLPVLLGLAASIATALGGAIALRFRAQRNLVMGLSAGIVLGVALFELIPEALRLAGPIAGSSFVLGAVAIGFALLFVVNRLLQSAAEGALPLRRDLAPAVLTLHSLADGAGITIAFQLSPEIGWSVAIAVLSHDIADGVNIVGTTLAAAGRGRARLWLALNGAAPLVGVALGYLIDIPATVLVALLGGLAGAFLYVSTSELLPRSYRMDRRLGTTLASLSGFALIYVGTILH